MLYNLSTKYILSQYIALEYFTFYNYGPFHVKVLPTILFDPDLLANNAALDFGLALKWKKKKKKKSYFMAMSEWEH